MSIQFEKMMFDVTSFAILKISEKKKQYNIIALNNIEKKVNRKNPKKL